MKTIQETFEDAEYNRLIKAKGDLTWREFILTLATKQTKGVNNGTSSNPFR